MKLTARLKAAASAAKQFARVAKFYAGVELPVRLGVAVIADGRCRPRWYGSDQAEVVERLARYWWAPRHFRGVMRRKLTPADYYLTRALATGSDWQQRQYERACKC